MIPKGLPLRHLEGLVIFSDTYHSALNLEAFWVLDNRGRRGRE